MYNSLILNTIYAPFCIIMSVSWRHDDVSPGTFLTDTFFKKGDI